MHCHTLYFKGPPNSPPIEGIIRRIPNMINAATAMQQYIVTVNPNLKYVRRIYCYFFPLLYGVCYASS